MKLHQLFELEQFAGKTLNHLTQRPEFNRLTQNDPRLKKDLQDAWEGDAKHPGEDTLFDKLLDKHAQQHQGDLNKKKDIDALKQLHNSSFKHAPLDRTKNVPDKFGPYRSRDMRESLGRDD
jgi:hypothetical protein